MKRILNMQTETMKYISPYAFRWSLLKVYSWQGFDFNKYIHSISYYMISEFIVRESIIIYTYRIAFSFILLIS